MANAGDKYSTRERKKRPLLPSAISNYDKNCEPEWSESRDVKLCRRQWDYGSCQLKVHLFNSLSIIDYYNQGRQQQP